MSALRRGHLAPFVLLAFLLAGCGGPLAGDAGAADASEEGALPFAQVGRLGPDRQIDLETARPADFGCLGTFVELRALGESTHPIAIYEAFDPPGYDNSRPVPGIDVCAYSDGVVPPSLSCDPPGVPARTDSRGEFSMTAPWPGLAAFRTVAGRDDNGVERLGTVVHVVAVRPQGQLHGYRLGWSPATLEILASLIGAERRVGATHVVGTLFDCRRERVHGARIRIARLDGSYVEEDRADPHGARAVYGDGAGFPARSQGFTHIDGIFGWPNLAAEEGECFVEAWARTEREGPERVISCERVRMFPDHITEVTLAPRHAADCPGLQERRP